MQRSFRGAPLDVWSDRLFSPFGGKTRGPVASPTIAWQVPTRRRVRSIRLKSTILSAEACDTGTLLGDRNIVDYVLIVVMAAGIGAVLVLAYKIEQAVRALQRCFDRECAAR